MTKRSIYRVLFDRTLGAWVLRHPQTPGGDKVSETYQRQSLAIAGGREKCRTLAAGGWPAQLVVHGRSGRIRFEATYVGDPERSRG
jgi:hypothetical protein